MGYESGKTYWIVPRYNPNVALSVYGNTQVSQNRNVVVWDKQNIADQLWRIDVSNGYARIKSQINNNYALNIWLGDDKYGNCDIHTWSDNTNDSKINFRTIDKDQNLYLIQCYRNEADNNLYLTAESTKSGSNVKWAVRDERADQIWQLCTPQSSGSDSGSNKFVHEIKMPYNHNQKAGPSTGFRNAGCACTCGMDIASFYSGKQYTFADFRSYYDDYSNNTDGGYIFYSWNTPEFSLVADKTVSNASEAATIAHIKRYIANGTPVACHCLPVTRSEHWVVPYAYENKAGWESIWVLDPYQGVTRTMAEAMNLSCGGTSGGVDCIRCHPNAILKNL